MPQAGTETFGILAFEHRSGPFSTGESWLPEKLGFRGECAELGKNTNQARTRSELTGRESSNQNKWLRRETGRTRLQRAGRGGFVGSHIKEGEPPKLPLLKGVLFRL
jgi:hypothetical protein